MGFNQQTLHRQQKRVSSQVNTLDWSMLPAAPAAIFFCFFSAEFGLLEMVS
jgi:hypothetical protein